MNEPLEQPEHLPPFSAHLDQAYYQTRQDQHEHLIQHHRELMEHFQMLMEHHQRVQDLFQKAQEALQHDQDQTGNN